MTLECLRFDVPGTSPNEQRKDDNLHNQPSEQATTHTHHA